MSAFLLLFSPVESAPPVTPTLVYAGSGADPINFDTDGTLYVDGGSLYTNDPLAFTFLNSNGAGLDGIFTLQDCVNLASIDLSNNALPTFDTTGLVNLISLILTVNQLINPNFTDAIILETLDISFNPLYGIVDLTSCLNLITITANNINADELILGDSGQNLNANNSDLVSVTLGTNTGIADLGSCGNLATLNGSSVLTELFIANCIALTDLPYIPNWANYLNSLEAPNAGLSQSTLDNFLSYADGSSLTGGSANLTVSGGVQPTGGLANPNYISLTTIKGWAIDLN